MACRVFRIAVAALALAALCGPVSAFEGSPSGIKAATVLIVDEDSGEVLYSKNTATSVPIASISKLMTSVVTLDADLPLYEPIQITQEDVRATWPNHSRLEKGAVLTRAELLHLALLASDNRAAVALGRTYPGGMPAFVAAMNFKAEELAMTGSHFVEPSGLSRQNVSTAEDLAKLVRAAKDYPLIAQYSTDPEYQVIIRGRPALFHNTNAFVRAGDPDVALQKTGFTNAAGQCMVLYLKAAARTLTIVLLDSLGRYGPVADIARIRSWIDPGYVAPASIARLASPTVYASSKHSTRVRHKTISTRARAAVAGTVQHS
jgi:D-alanyl-D-alanine endopeptidase (penicillin-binding protein 7)